jgi:inosine/xanthosine triphosphatase
MRQVIIASTNPVKLEAVRSGFVRMFLDEQFHFEGLKVPSGVSDQPCTDAETLLGARNRAGEAARRFPHGEFFVGVEGGIEDRDGEMCAFAWVVVQHGGLVGKARTATFFLPPPVAELIRSGVELGEADDRVFGRVNSKQENGAVGILTGDVIDRSRLYEQAVVLALIPFRNEGLYSAGS